MVSHSYDGVKVMFLFHLSELLWFDGSISYNQFMRQQLWSFLFDLCAKIDGDCTTLCGCYFNTITQVQDTSIFYDESKDAIST